jgi:ribosome assembly protein SQT1
MLTLSSAALHKEGSSVFEVALHPMHPNPPLAVSGGEDDLAFLFNTNTGDELIKLSGHEDSVVAVGFSE